jgi:hypothetical protein
VRAALSWETSCLEYRFFTILGLAAFMLAEGMKQEAYKTAWGIYHTSYEAQG